MRSAHWVALLLRPSLYLSVSFYGFNKDGSELYDLQSSSFDGSDSSSYASHAVDPQTGMLGPETPLFGTERNWGDTTIAFIADKFLGDSYKGSSNAPGDSWADIYAHPISPGAPMIHCTIAMLSVCDTATAVRLDPSQQYLFFSDPATQSIRVIHVDLAGKQLVDTGTFIPLIKVATLDFSRDGSLVYVITEPDAIIHIYGFDALTGKVTPGGTLPLTGSRIYPAERR
jgi:hypothetical protein